MVQEIHPESSILADDNSKNKKALCGTELTLTLNYKWTDSYCKNYQCLISISVINLVVVKSHLHWVILVSGSNKQVYV